MIIRLRDNLQGDAVIFAPHRVIFFTISKSVTIFLDKKF